MLERIISRIERHEPTTLSVDFKDAAVLVPVTREDEPQIILTRRSDQLKTHSGQVAFPGGMREDHDSDLLMTALRETEEEVGIRSSQVEVLGSLSQVISRYEIRVTPYVGLVDPEVRLVPDPAELDSVFKVPVSYFLNSRPDRLDHLTYRGHSRTVPCWFYEGYEIWGMSAIILVDFYRVVFSKDLTE
ncbi:CoA pyrophosphatase [Hahella sp. CCB-MM4]|uniref:CoA pyrophosphatase n=1 Tax=Hahella sp. (strain CCB-MM4) TaxID=1926491 RepID=UPI000B9B9B66|nr:CoA pyrophosphatase [Hahella sp. CCB-MM4]OZG70118.1 CoA pyrophosphatase [Hahella sp. CCB-MM4]